MKKDGIAANEVDYVIVALENSGYRSYFNTLAGARRAYWNYLNNDTGPARILRSSLPHCSGKEICRIVYNYSTGKLTRVYYSSHGRFSAKPRKYYPLLD